MLWVPDVGMDVARGDLAQGDRTDCKECRDILCHPKVCSRHHFLDPSSMYIIHYHHTICAALASL